MQRVPTGFREASADQYTLATRADVLSGGDLIEGAADVPFSGSSIDFARSNFARGSAEITINDPTMAPTGTNRDVLALGNEIRLWRGMSAPIAHLVPLLTGVITDTKVAYDESGLPAGATVTLVDRCVVISDARLPWPVNASGSAFQMLQSLIFGASPRLSLTISGDLEDVDLPLKTFQRDRDDAVKQIVTALSAELKASGSGQLVVRPVPDQAGPPVDEIGPGDGGFLISGGRTISRDGVFNGMVARGNSSGDTPAPTSDLIVDMDPKSPTYWNGPFGHKPGFVDSSLLTSKDQANSVARAQLRNTIGVAKSVTVNAITNPAFEVGDLVGFRWPDNRFEQHILDTLSIPLTESGVMTASTRATQILADGVS